MLRILLVVLTLSYLVKFANLRIAYMNWPDLPRMHSVAGLDLLRLVGEARWSDALAMGVVVALCAVIAIMLLWLATRYPVTAWFGQVRGHRLRREVFVYLTLVATLAVLSAAGIVAARSMALLIFTPLTVFALLNPLWERAAALLRHVTAIAIILCAFALTGSKTIMFSLFLAMGINAACRGKRIGLLIGLALVFLVIYPYLIAFRKVSHAFSPGMAASMTVDMFGAQVSDGGPLNLLYDAFDAILNRLVGLDGLLVAASLGDVSELSANAISFKLVGYEGVGISLGLFGQLFLTLGSIELAALVYPLIVVAVWRVAVFLDAQFVGLGFASFGTFLYLKAVQVIIGGFRLADMKVLWATILLVMLIALAHKHAPRRYRLAHRHGTRIRRRYRMQEAN